MSTIQLDLADDIVRMLQELDRSVESAAREMIVLELYRRGELSSGRASEILGIDRFAFIRYASGLGIPAIDMTEDEWEAEMRVARTLGSTSLSPTPVR